MKKAKIGLVTVLYKSESGLPGFAESLQKQDYDNWILYLVDNSPSDDNLALIDRCFRFCRGKYVYIKNEDNVGVAKGNNIGIKQALINNVDYILLLNNDIEFYQRELLSEMLRLANDNDEKIIVPKIFYYGSRKIWMAGGYFQPLLARTPHIGNGKEDSERYNIPKYVSYAPTCFMFLSSSVFSEIGLMDEKFFVYYDDSDFVFRAYKKGYYIYYMPSLEIFHKVSSSTGGGVSLFTIYYTNRNRVYYIRKHYSLFHFSFFYSLLSTIFFYLFKYNSEQRRALLKGFVDGIRL